MVKILALVRERNWEETKWRDYFTIADDTKNPEQNLRDAIREFLLTDAGTEAIKESSEDFNWGDAMIRVPNATLIKYGIHPIPQGKTIPFSDPIIIEVVQDEILIPNEYYDAK